MWPLRPITILGAFKVIFFPEVMVEVLRNLGEISSITKLSITKFRRFWAQGVFAIKNAPESLEKLAQNPVEKLSVMVWFGPRIAVVQPWQVIIIF